MPAKKQLPTFRSFDNRKSLMEATQPQNPLFAYNNCLTQQNMNHDQHQSSKGINALAEKSIDSSFNSLIKNRKFSLPQISKSDAEEILNLKLLLIKKGKVFGRTVLRWGQLTQNGKITYFKSKRQTKSSGYYSLYQTTCFKTKVSYSSDLWRQLGLQEENPVQLDAIQLTLLSFTNSLVVVADPKDQKKFEQPMNAILHEMFKMSSNGELQTFLVSLQICKSLVSQSLQFPPHSMSIKSFSGDNNSSAESSSLERQNKEPVQQVITSS